MIRNSALLAAALAYALLPAESEAHSAKPGKNQEKCAGIVKAGKNDCGTARHDCAGQAAADGRPDEWIMLPKGLCERIAGGRPIK